MIDRRKYDLLLMCAPPAVGEATARGREIERERERERYKSSAAPQPLGIQRPCSAHWLCLLVSPSAGRSAAIRSAMRAVVAVKRVVDYAVKARRLLGTGGQGGVAWSTASEI